jgi:hypothetical protein
MPEMGGGGFDAGMKSGRPRVNFVAAWAAVQLAKLVLAARLPLFVDEAFYAWEARHPAWAYSDLPGLTAWLARLGLALGDGALALRLPFLAIGAAIPWLVRRVALRVAGPEVADRAAWLALLMPLAGLMGLLAVPDVALVAASLLAMDAVLALRERVHAAAALQLAFALVVGALAHYRFGLVLVAGGAAMLADARSRACLRHPGVLLALAAGALAWWPALHWNLAHGEAGLRFHLFERNPWRFHADGATWLPIQAMLVTPALFLLLLAGLRDGLRRPGAARLLAVAGAIAGPGLLALAFFADRERVSFHWPLAGWLVLLPLAAVTIARWRRGARIAVFGLAAVGLVLGMAFLAVAGTATWRERLAASRLYPNDVAGWPAITAAAKAWPREPTWIAGDFELAAQLAFASGRHDIRVLDSPLNRKHGRAAQLALWGYDRLPTRGPVLLAVEDSATPMKNRLAHYHGLCARLGALPAPRIVAADHGRKRYFVYRFQAPLPSGPCIAPALSWVDVPGPRARVGGDFEASGWAFKDGIGLRQVEIRVDGRVLAVADYGVPMPGVAGYWKISTDPNHPRVGWRARVDTRGLSPGTHWLGLRLHGADGSVEDAPEQAFVLAPPAR